MVQFLPHSVVIVVVAVIILLLNELADIRDTSFDIALQDNDYIQRSAFAPPQHQHHHHQQQLQQQQQQQLSYRQQHAPYTSYADLQVLSSPLCVPIDEHCSR